MSACEVRRIGLLPVRPHLRPEPDHPQSQTPPTKVWMWARVADGGYGVAVAAIEDAWDWPIEGEA